MVFGSALESCHTFKIRLGADDPRSDLLSQGSDTFNGTIVRISFILPSLPFLGRLEIGRSHVPGFTRSRKEESDRLEHSYALKGDVLG